MTNEKQNRQLSRMLKASVLQVALLSQWLSITILQAQTPKETTIAKPVVINASLLPDGFIWKHLTANSIHIRLWKRLLWRLSSYRLSSYLSFASLPVWNRSSFTHIVWGPQELRSGWPGLSVWQPRERKRKPKLTCMNVLSQQFFIPPCSKSAAVPFFSVSK